MGKILNFRRLKNRSLRSEQYLLPWYKGYRLPNKITYKSIEWAISVILVLFINLKLDTNMFYTLLASKLFFLCLSVFLKAKKQKKQSSSFHFEQIEVRNQNLALLSLDVFNGDTSKIRATNYQDVHFALVCSDLWANDTDDPLAIALLRNILSKSNSPVYVHNYSPLDQQQRVASFLDGLNLLALTDEKKGYDLLKKELALDKTNKKEILVFMLRGIRETDLEMIQFLSKEGKKKGKQIKIIFQTTLNENPIPEKGIKSQKAKGGWNLSSNKRTFINLRCDRVTSDRMQPNTEGSNYSINQDIAIRKLIAKLSNVEGIYPEYPSGNGLRRYQLKYLDAALSANCRNTNEIVDFFDSLSCVNVSQETEEVKRWWRKEFLEFVKDRLKLVKGRITNNYSGSFPKADMPCAVMFDTNDETVCYSATKKLMGLPKDILKLCFSLKPGKHQTAPEKYSCCSLADLMTVMKYFTTKWDQNTSCEIHTQVRSYSETGNFHLLKGNRENNFFTHLLILIFAIFKMIICQSFQPENLISALENVPVMIIMIVGYYLFNIPNIATNKSRIFHELLQVKNVTHILIMLFYLFLVQVLIDFIASLLVRLKHFYEFLLNVYPDSKRKSILLNQNKEYGHTELWWKREYKILR
ncbi:hypothetical protein M0813_09257 [Anaeramoeba flamelloides]|uniref:Uncharacterized protein n=1 Tax=Anaeramoeba flamelloides TaxID=1746091 RepID=A0ABQ8X5Q5_9EUKA|nr:hypothetical protein M0813_09257 [Anaeramoeba flamelloides]